MARPPKFPYHVLENAHVAREAKLAASRANTHKIIADSKDLVGKSKKLVQRARDLLAEQRAGAARRTRRRVG